MLVLLWEAHWLWIIFSVLLQIKLGYLDFGSKELPMIYHFFPNVLLCLAFNFLLFFGKHSFVLLFDLSKRFLISRPCTIPVLFYTVVLF